MAFVCKAQSSVFDWNAKPSAMLASKPLSLLVAVAIQPWPGALSSSGRILTTFTFDLLDKDGSGSVDADEFAEGEKHSIRNDSHPTIFYFIKHLLEKNDIEQSKCMTC